jgi:hypothetical protein
MVEGLSTTRSPDSIVSFAIDGDTYIVTANEGDDTEYGAYEERIRNEDIFMGTLLPLQMTADPSVFDPLDKPQEAANTLMPCAACNSLTFAPKDWPLQSALR